MKYNVDSNVQRVSSSTERNPQKTADEKYKFCGYYKKVSGNSKNNRTYNVAKKVISKLDRKKKMKFVLVKDNLNYNFRVRATIEESTKYLCGYFNKNIKDVNLSNIKTSTYNTLYKKIAKMEELQ